MNYKIIKKLTNRLKVSINTIGLYERKSKDLNKAQFDIVVKLARVLRCDVMELYE